MSKGNLFLGYARGSVGDVTFTRSDGEQIARARNRRPYNPKSNAQQYQRAMLATVGSLYKAGNVIFDHSFQGYSVGKGCQRRFMSVNLKALRSRIAAEIAAGTSAELCNGAVVAPGSLYPTLGLYTISEGSYSQDFFPWLANVAAWRFPSANAGETMAEYAERLGLVAGDLYTFVWVVLGSEEEPVFTVQGVSGDEFVYNPHQQYTAQLGYCRLQVKDVSGDTSSAAVHLDNYMEITASLNSNLNPAAIATGDNIDAESLSSAAGASYGQMVCGIIRSRLDEDLRSDSVMYPMSTNINRQGTNGWGGITSPYALAAWTQGTESVGDSDLILEGGDD